jgi:hypothetical protein
MRWTSLLWQVEGNTNWHTWPTLRKVQVGGNAWPGMAVGLMKTRNRERLFRSLRATRDQTSPDAAALFFASSSTASPLRSLGFAMTTVWGSRRQKSVKGSTYWTDEIYSTASPDCRCCHVIQVQSVSISNLGGNEFPNLMRSLFSSFGHWGSRDQKPRDQFETNRTWTLLHI